MPTVKEQSNTEKPWITSDKRKEDSEPRLVYEKGSFRLVVKGVGLLIHERKVLNSINDFNWVTEDSDRSDLVLAMRDEIEHLRKEVSRLESQLGICSV